MNKIITRTKDTLRKLNPREGLNQITLDATYKAQKKYGFEIGIGEHATWNNEADAFKHAYMQWHLSWYYGRDIAKQLGDMHEDETPNAPVGERNMDLWNNAIGREIAFEMQQKPDWDLLGEEKLSEIASQKIYEKMQQGELITSPNDKRKFENMELERLTEADRGYSNSEFKNFDEQTKELYMQKYLDDAISNNWQTNTEDNLKKKVASGEYIYVENYARSDGSRVHGYYRRKPTQ